MTVKADGVTYVDQGGSGATDVNIISPLPLPVELEITPLTPNPVTGYNVGVASSIAVSANPNRRGLILINVSSAIISLGFEIGDAVLNQGVTLIPFGVFNMDEFNFTLADVKAIASAAFSPIAIQEYE